LSLAFASFQTYPSSSSHLITLNLPVLLGFMYGVRVLLQIMLTSWRLLIAWESVSSMSTEKIRLQSYSMRQYPSIFQTLHAYTSPCEPSLQLRLFGLR
jgi:hypothetical protein